MHELNIFNRYFLKHLILLATSVLTYSTTKGVDYLQDKRFAVIDCFWGVSCVPKLPKKITLGYRRFHIDETVQIDSVFPNLKLVHFTQPFLEEKPVHRLYTSEHARGIKWIGEENMASTPPEELPYETLLYAKLDSEKLLGGYKQVYSYLNVTGKNTIPQILKTVELPGLYVYTKLDESMINSIIIQNALEPGYERPHISIPRQNIRPGEKGARPFVGHFIQLKGPEVTDVEIKSLVQHAKGITGLELDASKQEQKAHEAEAIHEGEYSIYRLTDAGIKLIVQNCPELINLTLRHCRSITAEGIKSLSYLRNFRSLTLYKCGITDNTLELLPPHLTALYLTSRKVTEGALKTIAHRCPNLEILDLRGCKNIKNFSALRSMRELKTLILPDKQQLRGNQIHELLQE